VLSNPTPPWAVAGGVRDVLEASAGRTWTASGAEARAAGARFLALEGIDLHPAAEVGLAGLVRAIRAGAIGPDEVVLFHATGGGRRAQRALGPLHPVEPDVVVEAPLPDPRLAARHLAHQLLENA
jgi:cysteate synthase